jgi:3-hydroxybutyryl-CoA dehydratase
MSSMTATLAPTTTSTSIARWLELCWGIPEPSQVAFADAMGAWQKAWEESLAIWAPQPAPAGRQGWAEVAAPLPLAAPRMQREYPPGRSIDQLEVGQQATFTKLVTQAEIDGFAQVTGDDNPVHIDEEWAAASVFKGRISHGLLTAGLISATIGTQLPGPGTIYMSQTLRWTAPVRSGDMLTCTVTVKELIPEKNRAILTTVVACEDREVLVGEAIVVPPLAAT